MCGGDEGSSDALTSPLVLRAARLGMALPRASVEQGKEDRRREG